MNIKVREEGGGGGAPGAGEACGEDHAGTHIDTAPMEDPVVEQVDVL